MAGNVEAQAGLPAVALSVAGSDSGAGAGIQADLKAFAANGVYGVCALTVITAQSTTEVTDVYVLPSELLESQLDCLSRDFNLRAAKTGALGSPYNVACAARFFRARPDLALTVDPVTISKHGFTLADDSTVSALRDVLLPLACIVTPNLHEAAALLGCPPLASRSDMETAAQALLELGCAAVVLKGGHRQGDAADYYLGPEGPCWLEAVRVDTPHSHGTGCTFSAAITAHLSQGAGRLEAVRAAKQYITGALQHAQAIGRGISPVNHFWRSDPGFGLAAGNPEAASL